MNFGITFYHSQHYKYSGSSKNTDLKETRFNLEEYRAESDGPSTVDKASISHTGTVKDTINVQINTAKFGIRSYSTKDGTIKRYFNPSYTIKFKKPTHKVIYKYGYNDKVYKSYDITDGDKITADTTPPQNPTRTGYIFAGWSGDRTSIVCADRTLTATWTPCTHNVAYDTNGGTYDDTVNDNDNNYKIIKNGEYAIKSKMAGGRYIHAIHAGMDNGVLPCIYPDSPDTDGWTQSRWIFERYGNTPYYYIINKKSGKVLSSKGSDDYVVHQWSQPLNNNSLWYLKEGDNGAVYICNKKSDLVLDVSNKKDENNATIGLNDQKTADNLNQQWKTMMERSRKIMSTICQKTRPKNMERT